MDLWNEHFINLYNDAKIKCEGPPTLPRQRRVTKKIGQYFQKDGKSTDHAWNSPEEFYKKQYFEIVEHMIVQIKERFNQEILNYVIAI